MIFWYFRVNNVCLFAFLDYSKNSNPDSVT